MQPPSPSSPAQIGWARATFQVCKRIWVRQGTTNLGLLAAGIAFYGLLSLFPGITALVAITGLLFNPDMLIEQSETFAQLLPEAASEIVMGQVREVLGADQSSLSFAAFLALAIALYSASKAVANFVIGLNAVYQERETRGIIILTLLKLGLTLTLILGVVVFVLVVAALPGIAALLGDTFLRDVFLTLRWPILLALAATGIAVLYRFGPDRRGAKWRWITPGAGAACVLWVLGSFGFSQYVQSFGAYNETFGALGGVIILLTWLWLSSFIILLGALVDAEIEAQTAQGSSAGPDRAQGAADAYAPAAE